MRSVRLTRAAFINGALCEAGSVVEIGNDTALAPFMAEIAVDPAPAPAPAPPPVPVSPAPDKTVTVRYHPDTSEIDIDVDGVATRIDHATLKIETD